MSSQSIHVFPDVMVFFFFLWVNDILLYIFLRSILVVCISNSSCLLLSHTPLFGCAIFCLPIVLLHDKHFCLSLISGSILCPYHNFPSFPHSFPHCPQMNVSVCCSWFSWNTVTFAYTIPSSAEASFIFYYLWLLLVFHLRVSIFDSFLLLSNILLYGWNCSFIHFTVQGHLDCFHFGQLPIKCL